MATFFGMLILLVGLFFTFIGRAFPNLQNKGIFCALWIFGGMFIGIGGNPAKDAPNGSPLMVTVGIICTIVGFLIMIVPYFLKKEISSFMKIAIVVAFSFLILGIILSTCDSEHYYYHDNSYETEVPDIPCYVCGDDANIKYGEYYYCTNHYTMVKTVYENQ